MEATRPQGIFLSIARVNCLDALHFTYSNPYIVDGHHHFTELATNVTNVVCCDNKFFV